MLVDRDHKIIAVNPAVCNMLGYDQCELTYKLYDEITHPAHGTKELFDQLFSGELKYCSTPCHISCKNECIIRAEITIIALQSVADETSAALLIVQDVTDTVDLVAALKHSIEIIKKTRTSFKSRQLAALRRTLETCLARVKRKNQT